MRGTRRYGQAEFFYTPDDFFYTPGDNRLPEPQARAISDQWHARAAFRSWQACFVHDVEFKLMAYGLNGNRGSFARSYALGSKAQRVADLNLYHPLEDIPAVRGVKPIEYVNHYSTHRAPALDPELARTRRFVTGFVMGGMAMGFLVGGVGAGMAVGEVGFKLAERYDLLALLFLKAMKGLALASALAPIGGCAVGLGLVFQGLVRAVRLILFSH